MSTLLEPADQVDIVKISCVLESTLWCMGLRHQQTSQCVHQVRAILAASCGSKSSLRFTDASGDDVAFSVPEQGQRGLEARGRDAILLGKRMINQWTWGILPYVGHDHMR